MRRGYWDKGRGVGSDVAAKGKITLVGAIPRVFAELLTFQTSVLVLLRLLL